MNWDVLINVLGIFLPLFISSRKNNCNTCGPCLRSKPFKTLDVEPPLRCETESALASSTPSSKLERKTNKESESIGFFPAVTLTILGVLTVSAVFGDKSASSNDVRGVDAFAQQQVGQLKVCELDPSVEIGSLIDHHLNQGCQEVRMESIDTINPAFSSILDGVLD